MHMRRELILVQEPPGLTVPRWLLAFHVPPALAKTFC